MFLNRSINRSFRQHGLAIRGDAATSIKEFLLKQPLENGAVHTRLAELVQVIKSNGVKSTFVDKTMVDFALQKLLESNGSELTELSQVLSAFDMPRYVYNQVRKNFQLVSGRRPLHGDAQDKANIFRERYTLLYQRLMQNDLFTPPVAQGAVQEEYYKITQIESLIGAKGRKCIFGMLTQIKEGKYFIEDLNGHVEIDLADANMTSGLFTENCFVLAEGELVDNVFVVSTLGFPPPQKRTETMKVHPQLECFGVQFPGKDKDKHRRAMLKVLKEERADDMIIIVSDVHLDKPKVVLGRLEKMFSGFVNQSVMFVLMGNFTSKPVQGAVDVARVKAHFDALADMLLKFPSLVEKAQFLLVCGPGDPSLAGSNSGHGNVLPKPPIAAVFTSKLKEVLGSSLTVSSNPARVLYCGKELVFLREDLLNKMRRSCIVPPSEHETSEVSEHLVKTICDQAHLSPLPLTVRPVYWNYDYSLRMYPLPSTVVLADSTEPYDWTYEDCQCVNPGPFHVDFNFVVYYPALNKAEFSKITTKSVAELLEEKAQQDQSSSSFSTSQMMSM